MTSPTFSVVVPLYNKESSVTATIESVLAQTFAGFELIVVDDGSTDESRQRVLAVEDLRIRLHSQPNAGVAHARNAGIRLATAPYIALLDADDLWHPEFLERIHKLTKLFPTASAYATRYAFRQGSSDRAPSLPGLTPGGSRLIEDYFRHVAEGDMLLTASSVCMPTSVLQRIGDFPPSERIGEDQDLWIRVALDGPIAWDDRCSVYYRQDADAMATRARPEPEPWPFVMRLLQRLRDGRLPEAVAADARRYAARQLVGQASQLLLDGQTDAARRLLSEPEARAEGSRYYYWRALAALPRPCTPWVHRTLRRFAAREPSPLTSWHSH
jgi:glycosyltransferase involved in cell wall biosynthesis